MHLLQYADDTCLISDGPADCTSLLVQVEKWLHWSGMKAKVSKCHSLALQASTAKAYNPCLTLYGQPIHCIGNKFLGVTVQVPLDHTAIRDQLALKLQTMLQKVDCAPVTVNQKLLLYRAAICPRLNWDFMANELPMSWIMCTLEAEATRYLKKWVGLAKHADPSRFYLPKKQGGLELPSISALYQKQSASVACQMLTSHDPAVRHITTLEIRREETLN